MGVPGLWNRWAKDLRQPIAKGELRGKRVALDVSLLVVAASKKKWNALVSFLGGYTGEVERAVVAQISSLRQIGLHVTVVFDGPSPQWKADYVGHKRADRCQKARAEALALLGAGMGLEEKEVTDKVKATAMPTARNFDNLKKLLRERDVHMVQAPNEADLVIARLVVEGQVDFAMSSDSDVAIRGGLPLLWVRSWSELKFTVLTEMPPLPLQLQCADDEGGHETQLRWYMLASVSGCDYGKLVDADTGRGGPCFAETYVQDLLNGDGGYGTVQQWLKSVDEGDCVDCEAATEDTRMLRRAMKGWLDQPDEHVQVGTLPSPDALEVTFDAESLQSEMGDVEVEIPATLCGKYLECRGIDVTLGTLTVQELMDKVETASTLPVVSRVHQTWIQPVVYKLTGPWFRGEMMHSLLRQGGRPQGCRRRVGAPRISEWLDSKLQSKVAMQKRVERHFRDGHVTLEHIECASVSVNNVDGVVFRGTCAASQKVNVSYTPLLLAATQGRSTNVLDSPMSYCSCVAGAGGCSHLYAMAMTLVAAGEKETWHACSSLPRSHDRVFQSALPMEFVFDRSRRKKKANATGSTKAAQSLHREIEDAGLHGLPVETLPSEEAVKAMVRATASTLRRHGFAENLLVLLDDAVVAHESSGVTRDGTQEA